MYIGEIYMLDNTKILIIEDDITTSELLYNFLCDCNFIADIVETITDGISFIKQNNYDIILLDLNLPDFSGFELLKEIKQFKSVPIIIISAYSDTKTKVKAFKYGANDYMTKPVDLEELEARIWALLSRHSEINIQQKQNTFHIKDNQIFFKDIQLNLTTTEFEILSILIKNQNQLIKRDVLAASLSTISSSRSLDYHIKNIRKKIGDNGSNSLYLKTEYGMGYKLIL
jgi:DNA-binding response OmpR family regulator